MSSEFKRKFVHISMVGWALAIGRLDPIYITLLCLIALLFNIWVLPVLTSKGLERQEDLDRGFSVGMLAYPSILLVISLIFFKQQVFMAVAWGAMAFGDGFAGFVGARLKGPKIPWNSHKSISGTLSFIALGSPLTIGLIWLLPESSRLGLASETWFLAIICAVVAAALMETIPGMVDDNIVVPMTAALVCYIVAQVNAWPPLPEKWVIGAALVALLTATSIGMKKIDVPGGLCGGVLAWCIFLGAGLNGLLSLFLFFALGTLASHWKMAEKEKIGAAQENKGKRSVRHALSNGGAAAICGLLAWLFPEHALIWKLALAASLASATADTVASELGTIYGRRFVNILTLKEEQRGLDGVISLQGTLLGALGACFIAIIYGLGPGGSLTTLILVALAGIMGNAFDSVLGATLQRRNYMTNNTVNFANTCFAAIAGALMLGWQPFV